LTDGLDCDRKCRRPGRWRGNGITALRRYFSAFFFYAPYVPFGACSTCF
jgi:hypothetical protein